MYTFGILHSSETYKLLPQIPELGMGPWLCDRASLLCMHKVPGSINCWYPQLKGLGDVEDLRAAKLLPSKIKMTDLWSDLTEGNFMIFFYLHGKKEEFFFSLPMYFLKAFESTLYSYVMF